MSIELMGKRSCESCKHCAIDEDASGEVPLYTWRCRVADEAVRREGSCGLWAYGNPWKKVGRR